MKPLELTTGGLPVDTRPEAFGYLLESGHLLGDGPALRRRMDRDGYLYIPGFFDREEVRAARLKFCEVLADAGWLDPAYPIERAIAAPTIERHLGHNVANEGPPVESLHRIIYGDRIMGFYSDLLGGPATHFDFTWMRLVRPGKGSPPHCDVVFMGRGTKNLYTAWVPLGDIPLEVGGLVLVEGSNHDEEIRRGYCEMDVDTACQNMPEHSQLKAAGFTGFGHLSDDMPDVRRRIGARLLTAKEYRMGDLLTFSVYTVHGSLDNQRREVRLSSDSRYQLASEPLDERWVGEHPPGHGGEMIRNLIC